MSELDQWNMRGRRTEPVPVLGRCRVVGCRRSGYGQWCHTHTPDDGAGIIRCLICGRATADHGVTETCIR